MRLIQDFQIDGNPIVVPDANVRISKNDLDAEGSGRDEQGYMHRVVLRKSVRKWSFHYASLTQEEYSYMSAILDSVGEFVFTFPEGGTLQTTLAYSSSNDSALYNAAKGIYKDFSFNVIEC